LFASLPCRRDGRFIETTCGYARTTRNREDYRSLTRRNHRGAFSCRFPAFSCRFPAFSCRFHAFSCRLHALCPSFLLPGTAPPPSFSFNTVDGDPRISLFTHGLRSSDCGRFVESVAADAMAYSHPCPHFSSSAGNAQFVCISHRKAADFSPFRPTLALMHAFMLCKREALRGTGSAELQRWLQRYTLPFNLINRFESPADMLRGFSLLARGFPFCANALRDEGLGALLVIGIGAHLPLESEHA